MITTRFAVPLAALLLAAAAPAPMSPLGGPIAAPSAAATRPGVPAGAPANTSVVLSAQPRSQLDQAARALSREDLANARKAGEQPLVLVGSAKLNATDRPALFVQLQSPRECGSAGCSTSVYLWRAGVYTRILDGVGGKLAISSTRTRGMADLVTESARYVWDGKEYHDTRPAPALDLRPRR